jgi:NAD(P)H dehydrogenase (quinone)
MSSMIAVSGATGQLGGQVARSLAARGHPQRLIVRDPARAPRLRGAEIAVAEYGADSLTEALRGIDTFFMVSASEAADRVGQHVGAVDSAVRAGVRRIVYVSFAHALPDCTFTFGRDHWHTEQHIRASGLTFTFLRDNLYADLLPLLVGPDDVIRGPAGEGRLAAVARSDAADVAVEVLLGAGYDARLLQLTGPAAITLHEAAESMTRAWGRPIRYQPETIDEAYASRRGIGAPDWEVDGWVSSYAAIANGELAEVSPDIPTVLSRPAASLDEVLGAAGSAH